jgi:succinoglycan biosynthesis protein ExoM
MTDVLRTRSVDICVCTFRRPQLEDCLRSLFSQAIPEGVEARILVSDNDETRSAQALVSRLAQDAPLPVVYLHSPSRNISIARNACLAAQAADFVAFIDDDETASPQWLSELLSTAETSGAEIVVGPVQAKYAEDAPAWMRRADLHSTYPVTVGGEIRTGYTCNVLMDMRSTALAGRWFNIARGRTGGEDTEFFDAAHRAGGRIDYAPKAIVEEIVTPERATLGWLMRRRFRMGQTNGHLRAGRAGGIRLPAELTLAAAKVAYCMAASALTILSPAQRYRNWLRGVMHAGAISGLLGGRELRLYDIAAGGRNE